jgi:hypothetical protein
MAGSLVVGLASDILVRRLARRINPLNTKLIQIVGQLTDRLAKAPLGLGGKHDLGGSVR